MLWCKKKVPKTPPQILIHKIDPQVRWFSDFISFQPRIKKGKNKRAPITCSHITINSEETSDKFCLRIPSKLQRKAAKRIAAGGRYFFIILFGIMLRRHDRICETCQSQKNLQQNPTGRLRVY